ncbi:hypothetical protein B0J17DRAFT_628503 [Rhizoctonia solani]|nr:hypothetical protein B0J17DRAFT_628503 [Rhizoctonia solani]
MWVLEAIAVGPSAFSPSNAHTQAQHSNWMAGHHVLQNCQVSWRHNRSTYMEIIETGEDVLRIFGPNELVQAAGAKLEPVNEESLRYRTLNAGSETGNLQQEGSTLGLPNAEMDINSRRPSLGESAGAYGIYTSVLGGVDGGVTQEGVALEAVQEHVSVETLKVSNYYLLAVHD